MEDASERSRVACDHCGAAIASPRPGQRFCSNSGRCRHAWHGARRANAVRYLSTAIDALEETIRTAGDVAREGRRLLAFEQPKEKDG